MSVGVSNPITFEDNLKEVAMDWLIDPFLKIRPGTSGYKELGPNDAVLHASYDPLITPERLTIAPGTE